MKLVFATNNAHKLAEARKILSDIEILSLDSLCLQADIPEDGNTLQDNSLFKAEFVAGWLRKNMPVSDIQGCFADDTGLEIEALGGAPGVYTARYAGEPTDSAANRRKVLEELRGKDNRAAQFRTVMTLITFEGEENSISQFEGIVRGQMATEERGERGFGYDSIFIPEGYSETFAQLPEETKNSISHRSRALKKMRRG